MSRPRFLRKLVRVAFAAATLAGIPGLAGAAEPVSVDVTARPIPHFRIGRPETRFGPFEFVGGLELVGSRPFGGLSAFRFRDGGRDFAGVADTGFWYFGRVDRGEDGRPTGWSQVRMQPISDVSGQTDRDKVRSDAEGLGLDGDRAIVSFERDHKVLEYRLDPERMGPPLRAFDFLVPRFELRRNRGFETVIVTPENSVDRGAVILIAEKSLDRDGNIFGAILGGPRKGVFAVARTDDYDITDGAMLPDGNLLILERKFVMPVSVFMRLRRLSIDSIGPGRLADGPVLMEANMAYQIDNMEGIDVWQRKDGATMVSLISDDNHSFLQRTLYLEFRMSE